MKNDQAKNRPWKQRRRVSTILCGWMAVECPQMANSFSLHRQRSPTRAGRNYQFQSSSSDSSSSRSSFPFSALSRRKGAHPTDTNHTFAAPFEDCPFNRNPQVFSSIVTDIPWRHQHNKRSDAAIDGLHRPPGWKSPQQQQQQQQQQPVVAPSNAASKQSGQQQDEVMLARLFLILAAALYGTSFSLVKLLMCDDGSDGLPVGLSTTLRFGVAALATSPWLFSKSESNGEESSSDAAWAGFEVGMWNSVGYVAQSVGLTSTGAGESAFLCSLAVVVVPFFNWFSGAHLKTREWIGAALALAGVALLELGGSSGLTATTIMESDLETVLTIDETTIALVQEGTFWTFGRTASMIQPLAFGMGFLKMEEAMQRHPTQACRSTAAQLIAVVLGSALYCAVAEGGLGSGHEPIWDGPQLQAWLSDPTLWALIAYTGIVSTALSIYLETRALKTLSAAETTILLSTEPIWGAAFAAVVIGEHFGQDAALGGLMILGGCLYSSLGLNGIQSLLQFGNNKTTKITTETTFPTRIISSQRQEHPSWSLVGATSAILGASAVGAWNNLSVGARLTALQVRDALEDLFL